MPEALAPRPRRTKREAHLLELAGDVERDDPVLACELRGMALRAPARAHESDRPRPARRRRATRQHGPRCYEHKPEQDRGADSS